MTTHLRAIRLFTSKIADSVVEGRALATEHDFTADKVKDDEAPLEDITAEYSQYVDPKYAEQIMQESLMIGNDRCRAIQAAKVLLRKQRYRCRSPESLSLAQAILIAGRISIRIQTDNYGRNHRKL